MRNFCYRSKVYMMNDQANTGRNSCFQRTYLQFFIIVPVSSSPLFQIPSFLWLVSSHMPEPSLLQQSSCTKSLPMSRTADEVFHEQCLLWERGDSVQTLAFLTFKIFYMHRKWYRTVDERKQIKNHNRAPVEEYCTHSFLSTVDCFSVQPWGKNNAWAPQV